MERAVTDWRGIANGHLTPHIIIIIVVIIIIIIIIIMTMIMFITHFMQKRLAIDSRLRIYHLYFFHHPIFVFDWGCSCETFSKKYGCYMTDVARAYTCTIHRTVFVFVFGFWVVFWNSSFPPISTSVSMLN